jgi:hypothetical protein
MPQQIILYKWSCEHCPRVFDVRVDCAQHEDTQHAQHTNDLMHVLAKLFAINANVTELIEAVEMYAQMNDRFEKKEKRPMLKGSITLLFRIFKHFSCRHSSYKHSINETEKQIWKETKQFRRK